MLTSKKIERTLLFYPLFFTRPSILHYLCEQPSTTPFVTLRNDNARNRQSRLLIPCPYVCQVVREGESYGPDYTINS